MIKPEQIKQVETTREAIVKGLVDSTIDAMLLEEAQGYNGVRHILTIPFNWEGFGRYSERDLEHTLETLEYDIERIIKEYLEQFIEQDGIYDGTFYSEDGEFVLMYEVE